MNERLIATGVLTDTAERDLPQGNHSAGWALVIVGVATAGLGLAVLGAHDLFWTIVRALP